MLQRFFTDDRSRHDRTPLSGCHSHALANLPVSTTLPSRRQAAGHCRLRDSTCAGLTSCFLGKARPVATPVLRTLLPTVLVITEQSGRSRLTPNRPLHPPACQVPEASSAPANPDHSRARSRGCSPAGLELSSLGECPLPFPRAPRLLCLLTAVIVLGFFVHCPPPWRSSMTF